MHKFEHHYEFKHHREKIACNETKCKNKKGNGARTVRKLSEGINFDMIV